ncbi:MAG: hypothetical protein H0V39_04295 [Nitrosomonas sp.]|nr:hypothetical protein [Nitrosomonas sp.]
MAYAEHRLKRAKRKLSKIGKNKSQFRVNEDETGFQPAASSVYNKDKKRASRFEVDHELENWWATEQRRK